MADYDLIIVGAGPAGLSAAATASQGGLRVLLLDEQPAPGGQIYRNIAANQSSRNWLGQDYASGARLLLALEHPLVTTRFNSTVWRLDDGQKVTWSRNGESRTTTAQHILLTAGAQERPVPFPGWTLPGVMAAGAAQILMKTAGMLPKDAVLAGSGPLLYLVAAQMIDAGCPPQALVETQSPRTMVRALRHLPRAVFGLPTLLKGIGLLRKIRAAGVPRYTAAGHFSVNVAPETKAGDDGAVEFSFQHEGTRKTLTCGLLLSHQGVIPATHMSRSAGIAHAWNAAQLAFQPLADEWGATSDPRVHVAGDGAHILGADAAIASGELAALDILRLTKRISQDTRNQRSSAARANLFKNSAIRPFLDALYAPPADVLSPPDDTIICRCEEVSAGAIRQSLAEGATGPRLIKASLRVGMGPCQGRMCDTSVNGILRDHGVHAAPPKARSPVKPVSLGELAALAQKAC
ncbi:MAG: FAD-dependent oxidoreductase [Pikeienuella sp.]